MTRLHVEPEPNTEPNLRLLAVVLIEIARELDGEQPARRDEREDEDA